ncbi:hypothetical protein BDZ89DRAFT_942269 [Hymenopellis radicata]|nr:hypothetical protein BDZ89DRAFT_942269 [Hymenopellis radicata]
MQYSEFVFDPECRYITSPFIPTKVLGIIRLSFASYALFVLIFSLVTDAHFANRWFAYFTHLTYIGLCAYFFASGLQTTVYAWGDKDRYLLRTWPRFLQIAHEFLWSTAMSFPPLVTLVYWGLLDPLLPTFTSALASISMHAVNSVFCAFEVFFTSTPAPVWWYAVPCDAVLALYCGMNYIFATPELLGTYVYSFLDPGVEGDLTAPYIFGIASGEVIVYGIMWGVVKLRIKAVNHIQRGKHKRGGHEMLPLAEISSQGKKRRRWWGSKGERDSFIEPDHIFFPQPQKPALRLDPDYVATGRHA